MNHGPHHEGTLGYFGDIGWTSPEDEPGALPRCLCAGQLVLDQGLRCGFCVRVHERWILTAHHLIDIPDLARRFRVVFNVLDATITWNRFEYRLDPDAGFFTSNDGLQGPSGFGFDSDYLLVALAGPYPAGDPSIANLARLNKAALVAGARTHIVQAEYALAPMRFPAENLEQYPLAGRIAQVDDTYIFHQTSTEKGASGSPIFDGAWNVIGIHTHGYRQAASEDPLRKTYNWGTRIDFILEDLAARFAGLPDIFTTVDDPQPALPPAP